MRDVKMGRYYRMLRKWQKRLRLLDWDIALQYLDEESATCPVSGFPAIAKVDCHTNAKTAIIYIAKDHPRDEEEDSIVHELVHVHMNQAYGNHDPTHSVEATVNCLTWALLANR